MGHKPFLVLADYLTRRGMAVLRYDDRGVGASTGIYQTATTFDFAEDARAALEFLAKQENIDATHIGVIGHSEGAIVAAMLAADAHMPLTSLNRTAVPSFIVLLASPGVPGDELLLMQNMAIGLASGMSQQQIAQANALNRRLYDIAMADGDPQVIRAQLTDVLDEAINAELGLSLQQKAAQKAQIPSVVEQLIAPWTRTFLMLDPSAFLKRVKIPVLALNGSKDLQVPPKENLAAIRVALQEAGNNSATIIELEGLNHLFQHATTGLPSEYGTIRETFAPEALQLIGDWILKITE